MTLSETETRLIGHFIDAKVLREMNTWGATIGAYYSEAIGNCLAIDISYWNASYRLALTSAMNMIVNSEKYNQSDLDDLILFHIGDA